MRALSVSDAVSPSSVSAAGVGRALLFLLVIYLPWPFGAVEAWSEAIALLLVAGIAGSIAWEVLVEKRPLRTSGMLLPPVLLAVVAVVSLVPLPVSIVAWISPQTVELKRELFLQIPPGEMLHNTTLCFYPAATERVLRLLIAFIVVMAGVIHFVRRPADAIRLLLVMAGAGGVLAIQALLQTATADGRIFWTVSAPVKSTSGPFVNYNHFCQFMNLSMGAMLALLLLGKPWGRGETFREEMPARLDRWVPQCGAVLLLGGLAIALSTSRGGVISMIAGAGVAAALLMMRSRSSLPLKLLSAGALALLVAVLFFGFEALWTRMGTLSDIEAASGSRWQVIQDVIAFIPAFPLLGIGLGNHEMVYPMFSNLPTWRNAQYIENEYVQIVEEAGIVGLVLVVGFFAGLGRHLWRIVRACSPVAAMMAVGVAYALTAVAVGSISDFGQRIASVSLLTAMMCALVVTIGRVEGRDSAVPLRRKAGHAWMVSVGILAVLWMAGTAFTAAMAEYHWKRALPVEAALIKRGWQGGQDAFENLTTHARAAEAWSPGNAEYACWSAIYEWHALRQPWRWDALSNDQRAREVRSLLKRFDTCAKIAPTYGLSFAMAGQIRMWGLNDPQGAAQIEAAYRLAPTHPAVAFIAGDLRLRQSRFEEANEAFQRALARKYPRHEIVNAYLATSREPERAAELFAEDWEMLLAIATATARDPQLAPASQSIRLQAENVIREAARKPGASVQTLAAMADLLEQEGNLVAAAAHYRRALEARYGNAEWHDALSRILARLGDSAQADHEAAIAARLRQKP